MNFSDASLREFIWLAYSLESSQCGDSYECTQLMYQWVKNGQKYAHILVHLGRPVTLRVSSCMARQ